MASEAVILAGGLGTRLRESVPDRPKSMATINDRPFLSFLLDHLCRYRLKKAVLAVGFLHQEIISFFGSRYKDLRLEYSIEDEPLGTGGALAKASEMISSEIFLAFNGDTLFWIDLKDFVKTFKQSNASMCVALKPMTNFDRYGSVTVEEGRITSFNEKVFCENGLINGGIYVMRKEWLLEKVPAARYSLERDLMERLVARDIITGYESDAYFIDIGVPEDLERAGRELF